MSLINDALKRAKQAQQRHTPPVLPGIPMRPGETTKRTNSSPGPVWLVAGALLFGLVAVVVILVAARGGAARDRELAAIPPQKSFTPSSAPGTPKAVAPTEPALAATTPATPQPKPNPSPAVNVPDAQSVPSPQPPVQPVAQTSPTASNTAAAPTIQAPTPAVASAPPAPAKPEVPKLQGIFYRPDRPSAVVGGKTVFVGSTVGGYRVATIDQRSVTLVSATRTNVLSLEE